MLDKPFPNSLGYEESVLSTCFRDEVSEIVELLSPEDFYRTAHQKIFKAICELHKTNIEITLNSVVEKLRDFKCLEECGGAYYLAGLTDVPMALDIPHYCGKIKDKAIQRELIKECNEITRLCFDEPNFEKIIDEAQKRIGAISNKAIDSKDDSSISYRDLVVEAPDRYEELAKRKGTITGISSGFFMIDYFLCGFQPSDLIVLAAKPSMGKTALALNMAGNMGKVDDPVAIFSLEMSKEQLIDRQIAGESGVNSQKFRSGKFEKEDWPKIQAVQSRIYEWPVYIDDSAALHYREIQRRAWKLKKKYGIKALFIDHLQLIRGDKAATRDREIGSITAGLKATAKELKIPVILLSQLSRKVEERSNKRPVLSDLRDSGNIEQDADVVIFIYRPAQYKEKELYEGQTEINISKQRNGPTGIINLKWNETITRFYDVEKNREE